MAKKILVTGAAGFIGFHVCKKLLERDEIVVGLDSLSPYYDVRLKEKRLESLKKNKNFSFFKTDIADYAALEPICKEHSFDEIIHLAAQPGVRYSLSHPSVYAQANYLGTLNVFEAARNCKVRRVIYASSSSVYGGNTKQPFSESDSVERPVSLYAATKRGNELLAYTYHHLFGTEMVGLRFFTVYGEWGRPDMAYFKFTKRIMQGKPIDVYNNGDMKRSYTHIDDIVDAMANLVEQPVRDRSIIYNLGGDEVVPLQKFVALIERELGVQARKNMLPMQPGDVQETVADCTSAKRDLGYAPKVSIEEGIKSFVVWFKENKDFVLLLDEPAE